MTLKEYIRSGSFIQPFCGSYPNFVYPFLFEGIYEPTISHKFGFERVKRPVQAIREKLSLIKKEAPHFKSRQKGMTMIDYIWKFKFKIAHLLTDHPIKGDLIEFFSPHFPSTEQDKDYTEGQLTISLSNVNYPVKEIVTEGLRTVIALTNQVNLPVEIINTESPPGVFPGLSMQASGHTSFSIKESERIPCLWHNYQRIIEKNHHDLSYSIQWFMRAIKAEDLIDKFIYSWITFNMLYGWLAQTRDYVNGIKGLIGKGIPRINRQKEIVTQNKLILEALSQMTLKDHNINHAANLARALQGQDASEILKGAIEAIAFIRNNIFHGNLSNRTVAAERCIWPLTHLNAEIIKQQLEKI